MRLLTISWIALCTIACGTDTRTNGEPAKPNKSNPPTLVQEQVAPALTGSWILIELPQSPITVDQLFPRQKPFLFIQGDQKIVSGSTGCNRFSGSINTNGDQFSITELTSSTLKCPGEAEPTFLKALERSNRFSFRKQNEMAWGTDSATWMVFRKR
ncbi:MAG: META domain-containing protein [Bacteroidota bacterium]